MNNPDSVFSYYCRLIALRKSEPVIVYGSYSLLLPDDENLYVFTRSLDTTRLLVVCNFSAGEVPFTIPAGWDGASLLISNYTSFSLSGSGICELRPYEAAVLKLD
jgi:oligo-1,6-glucosidase